MNNNDILRSLRYTLKLSDSKMMAIFSHAGYHVTREQVCNWLKRDDDEAFQKCTDTHLASFLNGLINDKRGKKEGPQPQAEKRLNNNIVLRKLKIAFNLQGEEILEIITPTGLHISQHELSAFFRKPDHKHYRPCNDQILRNFLKGLQRKYRPESKSDELFQWRK